MRITFEFIFSSLQVLLPDEFYIFFLILLTVILFIRIIKGVKHL